MSAVLILAGGRASRFPGKLDVSFGGAPLLERVYHNVKAAGTVYCATGTAVPRSAQRLALRCIRDAVPDRGPLGGIVSAFQRIADDRIFVVAGDAPFVGGDVLARLNAEFDRCAEAVVPVHGEDIVEPLAAIYDRKAFLRAGAPLAPQGCGVRFVLNDLRVRYVRFDDGAPFRSLNTRDDMLAVNAWA